MENKLPLAFDKNGTSRFGTMHKDTKSVEWYYLEDDNVFIFHFTEQSVLNAKKHMFNFSNFRENTSKATWCRRDDSD